MNLQNRKRLTDLRTNFWLPIHTAIFKMDNQQRLSVQKGTLESSCCPPETITTLLISYIPIQN